MKPTKLDLRSDPRHAEAVTAELSDAELSRVSGGKASAVLLQKCATGKHFATVTITA
jgi:hypothetical protein